MIRSAAATMLIVLTLAACRDQAETPLVPEDILALNEEADQVMFGVDHYVTSDGIRKAHIVADTAFNIEDESIIDLRGDMKVTFFDRDGNITSILTAEEGSYHWDTGNMTARKNVVVVSPDERRRLETSVLNYNRSQDRIWSEETTRMFEPDGTVVEGTAFESDSSMENIELTSATFVQPGEGDTRPDS
jgi:LPS export ABC transporter protein LptC